MEKVAISLILIGIIVFSSINISPASAQTNKLVFAFDTVHGDVDTVIQGYVTDKGWSTLSLNKPLTLQYLVDSNVKVLHLSQFKKAFTDQEIRELKEWVDSGGIIMLAAWYGTSQYWQDLTRGFGITYGNYGDYRYDPTWTKEIADHPLLTDVQTLYLPYVCTLLSVRLPSTVLMTAEQGTPKEAIVALYESKGKLLVYPAQSGDNYETNYNLRKDNYLFLGNALRWFGQTATVTPTYVTTTTATKTTTSVSTVTQTTLATTTTTATSISTVTTFRTTTSTTTTTTATPVFVTTTSVSTTTKTTPMYFTTTSVTTFVTTSTDYANRVIVIDGNTFVLSSEALAGIATIFLLATAGLFLMIRRTVRQHAAK